MRRGATESWAESRTTCARQQLCEHRSAARKPGEVREAHLCADAEIVTCFSSCLIAREMSGSPASTPASASSAMRIARRSWWWNGAAP
eukprot:3566580-Rhodomonas_salina.1